MIDYYRILKEMVDNGIVVDNSGPIEYRSKKYIINIDVRQMRNKRKVKP
jgi:hypothetical protein